MNPIRIATRGSILALIQTDIAVAALTAAHPEQSFEVVVFETDGDKDRVTPLSELETRGAFAGSLRKALQDREADLAVHSLKDVPTLPIRGLVIGGVLERADPRDVLISRGDVSFSDLPPGSRIGTSSTRRAGIIQALRPDLEPVPIRGNVDTRLRKLKDGEVDALILAGAGLQRLGRDGEITEWLETEQFIPSPAQGVIAIECRSDDEVALALTAAVDHLSSRSAATAERAFLAVQGANCSLPVGALAVLEGGKVRLRGTLDGDPAKAGEKTGDVTSASDVGHSLGRELRGQLG